MVLNLTEYTTSLTFTKDSQEIQEDNKWKANPPSLSHTVPHLKRADSVFGFSPKKKKMYNLKLFFNHIKVELNLYYHLYNWETVTTSFYKIHKY